MAEEKFCIICGKKAKYDLCLDCYNEKAKIIKELEEATEDVDSTKDYYNNLKYNIFKLKRMDYAQTACLKLLALGQILEKTYKQKGYEAKSKDDAIDLLKKKADYLEKVKEKENKSDEARTENVEEEKTAAKNDILDYRRVYPMNIRCKDGHYVRSKSEKFIADYLFEKRITYVYEKRIVNDDTDEEYYPDFYLYIKLNDGSEAEVILEYFGLEDDLKYLATEKKKLEYYKSLEYDVIEVRKENDDNIEDYLDKQIRNIKKKYNK